MLVFLDTEFTSLSEPYLISIGMVAAESLLYVELADVNSAICLPFVRKAVLPLLTGPRLKPLETTQEISAFLAVCGSEITFFCDAPRYDIELLRPFLPAGLRWSFAVPSFDTARQAQSYENAKESAYAAGLRRHHALDDTKALALAWSGQQ